MTLFPAVAHKERAGPFMDRIAHEVCTPIE